MPRKTEILAEEAVPAVSSPRRSSRITVVNSPAPLMRTRRSSVPPETVDDESSAETKQNPRGKRGSSLAKDDPAPKPEPAKARSRRLSASAGSQSTNDEKTVPNTPRGRRSASLQPEEAPKTEPAEAPRRSVRSRRGSVELPEPVVKKAAPQRRRSLSKEIEESKPPSAVRTRRSSVGKPAEKADNREEEEEIEIKAPKLRRQSALNLESISEHKPQPATTTPDSSPVDVKLTPIKRKDHGRPALDLSVISESSFTEEPAVERAVSPRKSASPKLVVNITDLDAKAIKSIETDKLCVTNISPVRLSPKMSRALPVTTPLPSKLVFEKEQTVEENNLNSSVLSNGSDKENVEVEPAEEQPKPKMSLAGRVSNVFRPKNVDYSFVEPMEVDESALLNSTKLLAANKTTLDDTTDFADESFRLNLTIANTIQSTIDEKGESEVLQSPEKPVPDEAGDDVIIVTDSDKVAPVEESCLTTATVDDKIADDKVADEEENSAKDVSTDYSFQISSEDDQEADKSCLTSGLKKSVAGQTSFVWEMSFEEGGGKNDSQNSESDTLDETAVGKALSQNGVSSSETASTVEVMTSEEFAKDQKSSDDAEKPEESTPVLVDAGDSEKQEVEDTTSLLVTPEEPDTSVETSKSVKEKAECEKDAPTSMKCQQLEVCFESEAISSEPVDENTLGSDKISTNPSEVCEVDTNAASGKSSDQLDQEMPEQCLNEGNDTEGSPQKRETKEPESPRLVIAKDDDDVPEENFQSTNKSSEDPVVAKECEETTTIEAVVEGKASDAVLERKNADLKEETSKCAEEDVPEITEKSKRGNLVEEQTKSGEYYAEEVEVVLGSDVEDTEIPTEASKEVEGDVLPPGKSERGTLDHKPVDTEKALSVRNPDPVVPDTEINTKVNKDVQGDILMSKKSELKAKTETSDHKPVGPEDFLPDRKPDAVVEDTETNAEVEGDIILSKRSTSKTKRKEGDYSQGTAEKIAPKESNTIVLVSDMEDDCNKSNVDCGEKMPEANESAEQRESSFAKKSKITAVLSQELDSRDKKDLDVHKTKKRNKRGDDVIELDNTHEEVEDGADIQDEESKGRESKRKRKMKKQKSKETPKKEDVIDLDDSVFRNDPESETKTKLDEYLSAKLLQMEEESESEDSSDFIDDMAEEGEEDTPSEDSNQIIDEGESIHTESEEEFEEEEEGDDDSFICNSDQGELLPGDEYDLEDVSRKSRSSRIINVDDFDGDVITIERKAKPSPKRKSRIITVSSSSDEDGTVVKEEEAQKDKEPEATSTRLEQPNEVKKKSSITIHENIKVSEIQDVKLADRIHHLVGSFCDGMRKGDVAMNLSLEYEAGKTSGDSTGDIVSSKGKKKKRNKKNKVAEKTSSPMKRKSSEDAGDGGKKQRLSVSMDDVRDSADEDKKRKRERASKSLEDLSCSEIPEKKKRKKSRRPPKTDLAKEVGMKRIKSLQSETFNIMNQLITDVKNRPSRVVRPSTSRGGLNSSWTVDEVADVRPSRSLVSKKEAEDFKFGKVHPKDFRNLMLYNSGRVKRVETRKLLAKGGAYF